MLIVQSEKKLVPTGGESSERKRSAEGNGYDEPQAKRSLLTDYRSHVLILVNGSFLID